MSPFDDRFADRAREVFDTYAEPVDEPTWERVQTALDQDRIAARDRAPIAGVWARRSRALVALATLVLIGGVGTWIWQTQPEVPLAETAPVYTDAAPSTPVRPAAPESSARAQSPPARAMPGASSPPSVAPQSTEALIAQASPRSAPPVRRRAVAPPQHRDADGFAAEARALPRAARAPEPAPADNTAPAQVEREERVQAEETASGSPLGSARAAAPAPSELADRAPSLDTTADALTASGEADEAQGPVERMTEREEGMTLESAATPSRLGVDLVLATNAAFSGRQLAEGAGLTAGLSREWRVRNGLAISTGALASYLRLETDPDASAAEALTSLEADPSQSVEIPNQTTLSTVALEVPLDVIVDVARAGRGRIRAGVGLTTSLYLSQTFEDEGTRYALDSGDTVTSGGTQITTTAYSASETEEPLSRLDLGRQANVSLGYTLDAGRTPLSVDAYSRLPLGGLTSRDLPLTVVGLRLRVGF